MNRQHPYIARRIVEFYDRYYHWWTIPRTLSKLQYFNALRRMGHKDLP